MCSSIKSLPLSFHPPLHYMEQLEHTSSPQMCSNTVKVLHDTVESCYIGVKVRNSVIYVAQTDSSQKLQLVNSYSKGKKSSSASTVWRWAEKYSRGGRAVWGSWMLLWSRKYTEIKACSSVCVFLGFGGHWQPNTAKTGPEHSQDRACDKSLLIKTWLIRF